MHSSSLHQGTNIADHYRIPENTGPSPKIYVWTRVLRDLGSVYYKDKTWVLILKLNLWCNSYKQSEWRKHSNKTYLKNDKNLLFSSKPTPHPTRPPHLSSSKDYTYTIVYYFHTFSSLLFLLPSSLLLELLWATLKVSEPSTESPSSSDLSEIDSQL